MERSPEKDDYQDFDEVFEPHELPVPANPDYGPFLKGVIVGFGLAAVANLFFDLFREQRRRRRSGGSGLDRRRDGDLVGGISDLVSESKGAFVDAVDALDRTFDSGVRAVQSVKDVMGKCKDSDESDY